jgi:hypothetical protein
MPRYPFPIPLGWFQVCWPTDVPEGGAYYTHNVGRDLAVRSVDGALQVADADGGRTYPTIVRNGLVMFWYHPHDAPPSYEIPVLEAFDGASPVWSEPVRRHHPRINALWQELGETAADVAHIQQHLVEYGADMGGSDDGKMRLAEVVESRWEGPHGYMRLRQPFPTPWGPVDGHIDTDSHGPGFSVTWFLGLIDTGLIGCNIPIDDESTEIRFTFVCRKAEDEVATSQMAQSFMDQIHRLAVDDLDIWEHKAYLARPCLADTDGPIMKFRRWAEQFYVSGPPGEPTPMPLQRTAG